jgi:hypothetical protein
MWCDWQLTNIICIIKRQNSNVSGHSSSSKNLSTYKLFFHKFKREFAINCITFIDEKDRNLNSLQMYTFLSLSFFLSPGN